MENDTGFVLSPKWYNLFKWFVQIVLPAFGTAYLAADKFVNVPNEEAVVGIVLILATFLGTILGISNKNYKASDARFAGEIHITETDAGVKVYNLVVNGDPEDIDALGEATFKVASQ